MPVETRDRGGVNASSSAPAAKSPGTGCFGRNPAPRPVCMADPLPAGDSVHARHIHIDGQGRCPTAADAGTHNGNTAISTVDGQPAYGMIGTSLTTSGGTSPSSALAIDRFPTGSSYT